MAAPELLSYQSLFAKTIIELRPMGGMRRAKYDFAIAYPDPASMPLAGLLDGLKEALAAEGSDLALYTSSQGYPPLRHFVAAKLARDRNIHIAADDLLLTSGAGQAIHVTLETLLDPGDPVFVEDFTYGGALFQLRRFRADVRGVASDKDGMLPDALEDAVQQTLREGKTPKLVYTIPTFQNPQGWTMTLERRKGVVGVAQKYNIPILEDDCYADLRYDGPDVPSLYELDGSGRVIYIGSFSKTIAPGMRTGYMTAPRELLVRAMTVKSGGPVTLFAAFAIHRYVIEHFSAHIEEINDIQRRKRDAMLAALAEHFGNGASWSRPQGGLSLWVKLPAGVDVTPMRDKIQEQTWLTDKSQLLPQRTRRARRFSLVFSFGYPLRSLRPWRLDKFCQSIREQTEVGYVAGSGFAPDRVSGKNCLRLSFGYNQPAEIHEGIARLAQAFRHEGVLG